MTIESTEREVVVAERPAPGTPRPYAFPSVARAELENGLTILIADLPGRPLVSASMVVPVGAADEPAADGGAAVLAARALTEGTEHYDAVELTEATERLGASIHAEAGWDATSLGVDVPSTRLEAALELLAEVLLRPTFPGNEIERLRDERLNDLLQAHADPRRRADETFIGTIYAPAAPYHRPAAALARPSRRSMTPSLAAPTSGSSTPPGPRSSSAGTSADRMSWRSPAACSAAGHATSAPRLRPPSSTRAPRRAGWFAWSIDPAVSRPRSGSAIAGCRGACLTTTR